MAHNGCGVKSIATHEIHQRDLHRSTKRLRVFRRIDPRGVILPEKLITQTPGTSDAGEVLFQA
jgi:hypothetical protein